MASYGTDLNVVDLADSASNWAELSGHTSGAAPSADSENYIHNSTSVSQATGQATTNAAGMQCTTGTNYYTGWTSGDVFLFWQYYTAPTNINTWANGGMRVGVGSSAGNMDHWNAMGSNFGGAPYACWQNTAIDPEVTSDGSDGTPTGTNYSYFGSLPNVLAKITKGSPHAADVIRYGRGEIYGTSTGADFAGYATANDATGSTGRLGLFQAVQGGYLWKGLFSFGQSGTSITFSDSNVVVFVEDTPRVAAGFNKIEVNHSSSSVTLTGISILGVQTSITGSAPVSDGDFEVIDNATVDINSCTFSDMGTFVFNGGTNPNTIDGTTFLRCGQVTAGGAQFTDCSFVDCEDASSTVLADLDEVDGCYFESDGSNHAVNLGTVASSIAMDWNCTTSSYATSDGSTGNETILVSVSASQTLTINAAAGATKPTVYNTGAGDFVVNEATVNVSVHTQTTALADAPSVVVLLKASDGTGTFPFEDVVTITNSGTTATVSHTGHAMADGDKVEIDGSSHAANDGVFAITYISTSSYSYTMGSSPGSDPTGTITSTFVALYGTTDANGDLDTDKTYPTNQPVVGYARKHSAAPYYKESGISGTVNATSGFSVNTTMISDGT